MDEGLQKAAEHVAGLDVKTYEGAVYDDHSGAYGQGTGQLVFAHFAAGECHKLFVPYEREVEQGVEALFPDGVLDRGECVTDYGRFTHLGHVPALLVEIGAVGAAVAVAERDVADIGPGDIGPVFHFTVVHEGILAEHGVYQEGLAAAVGTYDGGLPAFAYAYVDRAGEPVSGVAGESGRK